MPRIATKTSATVKTATKTPRAKAVVKKASTKAAPAKKAPVKRAVAPTKVKAVETVAPVKQTFTKTGLIQELMVRSEADKKTVQAVLKGLEDLMLGSIHKRGVGKFSMAGLFTVMAKKVPAKKGGQTKMNHLTGSEYVTKAKPATVRVKIRAGVKMKNAAL